MSFVERIAAIIREGLPVEPHEVDDAALWLAERVIASFDAAIPTDDTFQRSSIDMAAHLHQLSQVSGVNYFTGTTMMREAAERIELLCYRLSHADDAISVLEGQLRADTGLTPIHQHTWYLKPDTDDLVAYCVGCGVTRGPFTITMPPVQRVWWNTSDPNQHE